MADELDDRLRDLARDAEPMVVLAGPQAARRHGERRRARRRAAAAGVATALALAVGGWQLLPRLEGGPDTGSAPPASTATGTHDPASAALQDRIGVELLPISSLPEADKWEWTVVDPGEAAKFPRPCGALPLSGASAQATRTYLSPRVSAVANYLLYAFTDAATAIAQSDALRAQMQTMCGISLPAVGDSPEYSDRPMRYSGTSKWPPGVTVWVESQGPYVAVLFVTTPGGDPEDLLQGTEVEKCIAASLNRLAPAVPTGKVTGKATAKDKATGAGGVHSPANC